MYEYSAKVVSVYDGDSVTLDVDMGLNIWKRNEKFRLKGINAPEVTGITKDAGIAARDYLRALITDKPIVIRTQKDTKDKYGRYLVTIFLGELNVNQDMIAAGHAVAYGG